MLNEFTSLVLMVYESMKTNKNGYRLLRRYPFLLRKDDYS